MLELYGIATHPGSHPTSAAPRDLRPAPHLSDLSEFFCKMGRWILPPHLVVILRTQGP